MFKHEKGNTISMVENTDAEFHRSKIIIHGSTGFYFAEFDTVGQLDFFANTLGFTYVIEAEEPSQRFGKYYRYTMSHKINDPCYGGFWRRDEIPADAKPIMALSNGSIVTCYYHNDGETIHFFRPNPNAKEVYNPLPLNEHISHRKSYGLY